jgi:hypothetical protein
MFFLGNKSPEQDTLNGSILNVAAVIKNVVASWEHDNIIITRRFALEVLVCEVAHNGEGIIPAHQGCKSTSYSISFR